MTTLATLITSVSSQIRDSSNATFSTSEVTDMINSGIDAIGGFYPREIVSTFATVSSSTFSYSASTFVSLYRVDIYQSSGSYRETVTKMGASDSPDAGWELHGGVLYLPTLMHLTTGDTLQGFGYGGYTQLAASTSVTDLDTSGIWALGIFCQAEAFGRLMLDRALFQQWQDGSQNTDISPRWLALLASTEARRWTEQQRRLRRIRKT